VAPEFQSKILSRSTTSDEYRIYRAALEWDLTDPIVIEGRDDFKSAKRWQERLTPYYHQVSNLITFCRRLPVHPSGGRCWARQDNQRGIDRE
jgi:hypothetical protein